MDEVQGLYTLASIFALAFGLIVGSFLNVCVHRIPRGESVVSPRSRCPGCMNSIVWYDNIPIISWIMLGAKCRTCGTTISWQYPLVEGVTGLLFFLVFWRFGFVVATPIYMMLAAGLVLITFIDLTDWTIPNEVTLPGIPIGIGCAALATWYPESGLRVLGPGVPVFSALIGAIVGGGSLYLLDKLTLLLLKKRGMGMGDVKLLAMLGAFFGWPGVIMMLIFASMLGSVAGVSLIMWARQTGGGEERPYEDDDSISVSAHYLPFGPYLCVAGLVVMFFGAEIYTEYVTFMAVGL